MKPEPFDVDFQAGGVRDDRRLHLLHAVSRQPALELKSYPVKRALLGSTDRKQ